jgi:hypothetical protein
LQWSRNARTVDRRLIDEYEAGAGEPARAIAGLTREERLARPVPGTWSIQEIVIHLMDSDLVGSDRMKRVAAEVRPLLIGFDENRFTTHLGYDRLDAALACEVFGKNRRMTAGMLRLLPDAAFARTGVHSETGIVTLEGLLRGYVEHLAHHMRFVREKRTLMGRPLDGPVRT